MIFRCVFWHKTSVAYGSSMGVVACERCGSLLDWWRITRPEDQHRVERDRVTLLADRERRAAQMAMPSVRSSKLLRMR